MEPFNFYIQISVQFDSNFDRIITRVSERGDREGEIKGRRGWLKWPPPTAFPLFTDPDAKYEAIIIS